MSAEGLFASIEEFPKTRARERFDALVGIDGIKAEVLSQATSLLDPSMVEAWSKREHKAVIPAVADVMDRVPLVVFAGDVGTGKTELAETVGEPIADALGVPVLLHPLSLSTRGHGAVGEMTTLLTHAFEEMANQAGGGRGKDGKLRHGHILLIDEADALAQSRELAQMHHEDRAGVNALIRGVDGLRNDRLPVLTIMCTNRVDALDPALRRRAAAVLHFGRPDDDGRRALLERSFDGAGIAAADLTRVVKLTGPSKERPYGCTYSDLRQRFVPTAVLQAMNGEVPVSGKLLIGLAEDFVPTRPFDAELKDGS